MLGAGFLRKFALGITKLYGCICRGVCGCAGTLPQISEFLPKPKNGEISVAVTMLCQNMVFSLENQNKHNGNESFFARGWTNRQKSYSCIFLKIHRGRGL